MYGLVNQSTCKAGAKLWIKMFIIQEGTVFRSFYLFTSSVTCLASGALLLLQESTTIFESKLSANFFSFSYRYKLSLIKPSVKALAVSSKVSMRTDHRGFLSLQYMIRNEEGQVCFVEYYVSCFTLCKY